MTYNIVDYNEREFLNDSKCKSKYKHTRPNKKIVINITWKIKAFMTCPNILQARFNNFNEEINAAEQFSVSNTPSAQLML